MSTGNNENELKYYSIGEITEITGVKQTVLRFWEQEFEVLTPIKNKFGHRVYTDKDIEIIIKIKSLLYDQGLTIKGAKSVLKSDNKVNIYDTQKLRNMLKELQVILKNTRNESK